MAEAGTKRDYSAEEDRESIWFGFDPNAPEDPDDDFGHGDGGGRDGQTAAGTGFFKFRPYTQIGISERFVDQNGKLLKYVGDQGAWYLWDGIRYKIQSDNSVVRVLMTETIRGMKDEPAPINETPRQLENRLKWVQRCETVPMLNAAVEYATGLPEMRVETLDAFDRNQRELNTKSGPVDLYTGVLGKPDPDNLVTKVAGVAYDPDAECPEFEKFLNDTLEGDTGTIEYLQKLFGYAASGFADEKKMFWLFGPTNSGKTTIVELVALALGDYAGTTPIDTFMEQRSGNKGFSLIEWMGKRLIVTAEGKRTDSLDESFMKLVTGNDRLVAAKKHKDEMEFYPTHTVVATSNAYPRVSGQDAAVWNRIVVIPFARTVYDPLLHPGAPPELMMDKDLVKRLKRTELQGILRWVVEGARKFFEDGLKPTPRMTEALGKYRKYTNLLAEFLEENTVIGVNEKCSRAHAYEAYKHWSKEVGYRNPVIKSRFTELMEEHGFEQKMFNGGTLRGWKGVSLNREGMVRATLLQVHGSGGVASSAKVTTEELAKDETNVINVDKLIED